MNHPAVGRFEESERGVALYGEGDVDGDVVARGRLAAEGAVVRSIFLADAIIGNLCEGDGVGKEVGCVLNDDMILQSGKSDERNDEHDDAKRKMSECVHPEVPLKE